MRELATTNTELAKKFDELERATSTKLKKHDDQIRAIFEAIKKIIKAQLPPAGAPKRPIGFRTDEEKE